MPFTPFHFGPGILLGLLLLKKLDFPTFVAANVMIDWRAALVFLGFWPPPRHGWVHTYLGATLMAILLGAVMIYARPLIDEELREMKIVQEISKKNIFLAAFSGAFLHVTIDAFHHPYMQPFMPFDFNPLLGLFSTLELRAALFFCLLVSLPVYVFHVKDWIDISP
ncbi:hypothetical protein ACK3SF_00700 [Candidatus Nanosalina sp. VS9-1]|uniref:hypothetical protein n=1 Tax=Candidatus Nanosalina sp. VS9-1 TaxID=3388566 RepID=UPI0039E0BF96